MTDVASRPRNYPMSLSIKVLFVVYLGACECSSCCAFFSSKKQSQGLGKVDNYPSEQWRKPVLPPKNAVHALIS